MNAPRNNKKITALYGSGWRETVTQATTKYSGNPQVHNAMHCTIKKLPFSNLKLLNKNTEFLTKVSFYD